MKRILKYLPHLIKSFRFCLSYFPLPIAIKFPVLIHRKVQLKSLKGCLKLSNYQTGNVKIGFPGSELSTTRDTTIINFETGSTICLGSYCTIGSGSRLSVKGQLTIGDNFITTFNCWLICEEEIKIGNNVLISWNTQIMDSDQHIIEYSDQHINKISKINIEDNVWIGSGVSILKNTHLKCGTVVASKSLVNKSFEDRSVMIAGTPARIVKNNINWRM